MRGQQIVIRAHADVDAQNKFIAKRLPEQRLQSASWFLYIWLIEWLIEINLLLISYFAHIYVSSCNYLTSHYLNRYRPLDRISAHYFFLYLLYSSFRIRISRLVCKSRYILTATRPRCFRPHFFEQFFFTDKSPRAKES